MQLLLAFLLASSSGAHDLVCAKCHPKEVQAYDRFSMAHSLRKAMHEPAGSLQNGKGSVYTVQSNEAETWQTFEREGQTSKYKVEYVIGSGSHASGYLVALGDHLFQSPICYYPKRKAYGMAPGYEKVESPDFTRPVTVECLLCHSGKPSPVSGSVNRYEKPAFQQEAISCERCHGSTEEHLKRPLPGSIVNPAKLSGAARDSVCEQCHLIGTVRVLNPGKKFEDFRPGQRLEEVFSLYKSVTPSDPVQSSLKVVSHAEQLAASICARKSNGKLWCGTCHDVHNETARTVSWFQGRCLSCHAGKLPKTHVAQQSNCVGCHMPRRETFDGAHTVFTDHRIMRRPTPTSEPADGAELAAWREPAPEVAARNLGLAYINAGTERKSPAWLVRGYRILTSVQEQFSSDPAVMRGFGTALLLGNQPREAQIAFSRVLNLESSNPIDEENTGRAYLATGDIAQATTHLERAVSLDPLLLSAVQVLDMVYGKQGETAKQAALAERLRQALDASSSGEPKH